MSQVYSTRLMFGPASSGLEYTVPQGYVAVLCSIDAGENATTPSVVGVTIDGSAALILAVDLIAEANFTSCHWTGRIVVNPGETVGLAADGGDPTVQVTAYLLSD